MAPAKKSGRQSRTSRSKPVQAPTEHESVISSIETSDLSAPPSWEFWEVYGFRFTREATSKLQPKLREVWSTLSRAQYTTIPPGDSNYRESKEQIKLRVSNNFAVIVQAHIHFRKIYGTPRFFPEVSKAVALRADQQIIQLITTVFMAARKSHIEHRENLRFKPSNSTLTDMVDQWVRFTESFSSLSIPKAFSDVGKELCHTWNDQVERGAMMNLAQRPRREGSAPTIPVVIDDDSANETQPSLPTKRRRADTVKGPQAKRRAPKAFTPSVDSSQVTEEESSPFHTSTSSFAPSSTDSGIGLLPSSPPLLRRRRARTSPPPFTPLTTFSQSGDFESIKEDLASHEATLANHDKRLQKMEKASKLQAAEPATTTNDQVTQIAAQVLVLEERWNSKEKYVKTVAREQFNLAKAGFDPLLKTANDRVNSLGEDLAILKTTSASDLSSLGGRVDKLEGLIGSNTVPSRSGAGLNLRSRSASNARTIANRAEGDTREGNRIPSVKDETGIVGQLLDLDKRIKYLEKQPSTLDIGNRLTLAEIKIISLEERDQARENEMSRLRREVEEIRNRAVAMGHGDVARLPPKPPSVAQARNNNNMGNGYRNGNRAGIGKAYPHHRY